jgi:K+-sensing histidine kinase KdpD
MGGTLQAIFVETSHDLSTKEREMLDIKPDPGQQLGVETRIVTNYDLVKAIVGFARAKTSPTSLSENPCV